MSYNSQALYLEILRRLSAFPQYRLAALARDLRLSSRTLEYAIGREAHTQFRRLRERYLSEELVLLCATPNLSLKEISARLGFSSPASLCRFARRVFGTTPSGLQNRHAPRFDRSHFVSPLRLR
jgi:AraC-like DNA-binding protein